MKKSSKKGALGVLSEKIQSEIDELYGKYTCVNKMTARQHFAEVTNVVGFHKKRVLVTNRDDPFVLIAPVEDLKKLDMLEEAGVLDEATLRTLIDLYKKSVLKAQKVA